MNVILPKDQNSIVFKKPAYREDLRKRVLVHGAMHYQCKSCNKKFRMWLEKGVEGKDKIQPCPFIIPCPDCGHEAQHVDWNKDIVLDKLEELWGGARFFAFDKSKKETACGIPSIYLGQPIVLDNNLDVCSNLYATILNVIKTGNKTVSFTACESGLRIILEKNIQGINEIVSFNELSVIKDPELHIGKIINTMNKRLDEPNVLGDFND